MRAADAGDQAFAFVADFTDTGVAEVRAVVSGTNTLVQLDADGDARADAIMVLTGVYALAASDFML